MLYLNSWLVTGGFYGSSTISNFQFIGGVQLLKTYEDYEEKLIHFQKFVIMLTKKMWPPLRGRVRASSGHLKTGTSRLGYGNPDRRFPGPPGWGLSMGLTTPSRKNFMLWNLETIIAELSLWNDTGMEKVHAKGRMTSL
jgi:hypothetical protein